MASGDLGGETSVLVGDEDVMPVLVRELSNAWRRSGEPSYDSASGDGAAPLGLELDCCGGRTPHTDWGPALRESSRAAVAGRCCAR